MRPSAAPAVLNEAAPAIAVENLARRYGRTLALRGLSFSVPAGALCGLIGPNGAGKTTLLSILATLDESFEGDAHIGGASVRHDPFAVRRSVGFVPDHAPLYDAMNGLELLEFFARASALPAVARRRAIERVVADCGISSYLDRPAAGLSKGQAQRLCVARALLHEPAVLLLDEPASGLDPRARIELKELLKKLGDGGTTVLVSSHILTELGDFCDHVVVMEQGRAVAAGRIDSLAEAHGGRAQDAPRRLVVEVDRDGERAADLVRLQSDVGEVFVDGNVLSVLLRGPRAKNAQIASALFAAGFGIVQLVPERVNLEALFLTVTKGGAA